MSYYFLYQKKGVPSWLAYTLILIMVVGISFGLKNSSVKIISRANKNLVPTQITVSNLTNETATIHFITKSVVKTQINLITPENLILPRFDFRDREKQTARQIHYFQLNQLKSNSKYQIEIFVDGKRYDKIIEFRTLNYKYPSTNNAPIFGKAVNSDLTGSEGTLVMVNFSTDNKHIYSTLTKNTGEWIITLPFVINNNLEEIELDPQHLMTLIFTNPELKKSTVVVKYGDAKPLRSIVLGQDYDFTKSDLVLGVKKRQSNRLITTPNNNSTINSSYPAFRGQASKNSLVKVVIEPNIANLLISTDNSGNWQYIPLKPLPIGQYRLYVKHADQEQTVNFQITKSGESILGEATPSANLTTTPTQIPTNIINEPSPTLVPSPTIQVIIPTNHSLTPTIIQEEIPRLGFTNNFLILLASGLSLLGLFLVLY